MKQNDILRALQILTPGAEFYIRGDSLEGLTWLDNSIERPTDDAIKVAASKPEVPASVPMWKAKAVLSQVGKRDFVDQLVHASGNVVWQAAWIDGNDVYRDSEMIRTMAPLIPMTDEEIDDLFIAADKLSA